MTAAVVLLLGALVAMTLVAGGEAYVLIGIVQRLRTTFEQLLAAAQQLLAAAPSKSAERTEAPDDVRPRQWYRILRRHADLREDQADEDALARWADDGGVQPTEPDPAPATAPMRLDLAGGLRVPAPPDPLEVDPWRARFTFVDGGRRAAASTDTPKEQTV